PVDTDDSCRMGRPWHIQQYVLQRLCRNDYRIYGYDAILKAVPHGWPVRIAGYSRTVTADGWEPVASLQESAHREGDHGQSPDHPYGVANHLLRLQPVEVESVDRPAVAVVEKYKQVIIWTLGNYFEFLTTVQCYLKHGL